jgi:hypothetical protein
MFGSRIKLDRELLGRCRKQADLLGYSSVEEFITHVLEKELRSTERTGADAEEDQEEMARRLKGLGYIE